VTFTLSLDTELIWGSAHKMSSAEFQRRFPDARRVVVRLLRLLEERRVSATWAVVGHLLLPDDRTREAGAIGGGIAWPATARSRLAPAGDRISEPLWYAADAVEQIVGSRVPQELGSHSFSHIRADAVDREVFRSELRASKELARHYGVKLRSFVFPWNVEAHHDVLHEEGFDCFRSQPTRRPWVVGPLLRAARFREMMLAVDPPTGTPVRHPSGLMAVPASMFFGPRHGVRRYSPLRNLVSRAIVGLRRAASRRELFHLWFHPYNLTTDPDALLLALDRVLIEVSALRESGVIDVLSMSETADKWSRKTSS
jgi:peptidoglycan/xylan/chitin deacetylase (PgdA/CDA1 family)